MDWIQSIDPGTTRIQNERVDKIKKITISYTTDQGNDVEIQLNGVHDNCVFSSVLSRSAYEILPPPQCASFKIEGDYEEMKIIVCAQKNNSLDENELMSLLENGV